MLIQDTPVEHVIETDSAFSPDRRKPIREDI